MVAPRGPWGWGSERKLRWNWGRRLNRKKSPRREERRRGYLHIFLILFLDGRLLCEEGVPLSVFPDIVIRVASFFDFSVGSRGLRSAVGNGYVVVQEYGWFWKLGDWKILSFVFPRKGQFV